MSMASVSIKVPKEYEAEAEKGRFVASKCYEILVDGREISGVTGVTISMGVEGVPRAEITFLAHKLEIDAVALASLVAHVQEKKTT